MGRLSRQLLAQEHEASMAFSKGFDEEVEASRRRRHETELAKLQGSNQIKGIEAQGKFQSTIADKNIAGESALTDKKIAGESGIVDKKLDAESRMTKRKIDAEVGMSSNKVDAEKEMHGNEIKSVEKRFDTTRADKRFDALTADDSTGKPGKSAFDAANQMDTESKLRKSPSGGRYNILLDETKRSTEYNMRGFTPEQRRKYLSTGDATTKEAFADELAQEQEVVKPKKKGLISKIFGE